MKCSSNISKKALISLFLVLSACQSPPINQKGSSIPLTNLNQAPGTQSSDKAKVNSAVVKVNDPIIPNIQDSKTDIDAEIIKQLIINNTEFFPENINKDDDALEATVPNNGGVVFATVPNNGGVVFMADNENTESFATKAVSDKNNLRNKLKEQIKQNIKKAIDKVKKKTIGEPKREFKINFTSNRTQADVEIITTYNREVTLNRNIGSALKNFKEESIVKSVFLKEDGIWKLNQISPIDTKTTDNDSKIKIESIKLTINSEDKNGNIKSTDLDINGLKNKTKLITLKKGDIITLEAKISNGDLRQDMPLQVFARLANAKVKIPLYDDGGIENLIESEVKQSSGDSIKNDDIYTTNIVLNNKKGVNYLVIDVMKPLSEDKKSVDNFNYISKSIPIVIM